MITRIAHISVPTSDYDRAIAFYTGVLGLELRADNPMFGDFRWVTLAVEGQSDVDIVLHKPPGGEASSHGLVFFTDDCRRDAEEFRRQGVEFTSAPEEMPWGVQAVFVDSEGNSQVLIEPSELGLRQAPLESQG